MRTPGRQPRILLTNVKQLELLLTRQQDIELFADARLDYLIFDEAHTFTGALGAETAVLIRRLRAFCNTDPDKTRCVATSATIVDREEPDAARNFAARFFGVDAAVATIGEDYEHEVWAEPRTVPPHPSEDPPAILDRSVLAVEEEEQDGDPRPRTFIGRCLARNWTTGPWQVALYDALSRNEVVFRINEELASPRPLRRISLPALEQAVGRTSVRGRGARLADVGRRLAKDGRPLLRPVVHAFVRGISGAVVSFPGAARTSLGSGSPPMQMDGWRATHARSPARDHVYDLRPALLHRPPQGLHVHGREAERWRCGRRRHVLGAAGGEPGRQARRPGRSPARRERRRRRATARTAPRPYLLPSLRYGPSGFSESDADIAARPRRPVRLWAVKQNKDNPGVLTSCLSCGAVGGRRGGHYREPARAGAGDQRRRRACADAGHGPPRATPAPAGVLRQPPGRRVSGRWMKDHARRFRLRALMADGIQDGHRSIGDLTAYLDDPHGRRTRRSRERCFPRSGRLPAGKAAAAGTSRSGASTSGSRSCGKSPCLTPSAGPRALGPDEGGVRRA